MYLIITLINHLFILIWNLISAAVQPIMKPSVTKPSKPSSEITSEIKKAAEEPKIESKKITDESKSKDKKGDSPSKSKDSKKKSKEKSKKSKDNKDDKSDEEDEVKIIKPKKANVLDKARSRLDHFLGKSKWRL